MVDLDYIEISKNKVGNMPLLSLEDDIEFLDESLKDKRETGFTANLWLEDLYMRAYYPKVLHDKGIGIWLNPNGKFSLRYAVDGTIEENITASLLGDLISNAMGSSAIIVDRDHDADIQHRMLKVVNQTSYNPYQVKEFYTDKNGNTIRNLYNPSSYLRSDYFGSQKVPLIMDRFFKHLLTDNEDEINYFLDELANHFQTFKGGINPIVLRGTDHEVRDVLYEFILKPIFGESNSVRISDEELDTKFLSRTDNKLLVFIDKVPVETSSRKAMSRQFQTLFKKRPEHTMIVVATNEIDGLGIERNPGGFSVLSCDNDICKSNYLETGSYQNLSKELECALEDFTDHLFYRKDDIEHLSLVINTPAKDSIMAATVNRIDTFIVAIKTKDVSYFESLNNTVHTGLYQELRENFFKDVVSKAGLAPYINALEGEEFSSKAIMVKLRAADKNFFNDSKNGKGSDSGDILFEINSDYNEYHISEA